MKIYKSRIIIIIILCSLTYFHCGKFEDINIDPNNTTEVAPETLLTNSLRTVSFLIGNFIPTLYVQYISEIIYTENSRYSTVNWDFNWIYSSALINLQKIIELNTAEDTREAALQSGSNANQIAVARILQSYFFLHLTDRWGPLPYFQALKGRENFKPPYDSQEDIYQGIFTELKEAALQIDDGPPVRGDFLFNGDMERWKKFANSLRLIAALRLSKVDPGTGKREFVDAVNAGLPASNEESITYPFLPESSNENPWYSHFKTRTDFALSNTLVDMLIALQDPRLFSYGDPTEANADYRGMPYGVGNPVDDPAGVSFPNSEHVRAQDAPLPIISYAQILFSMAEAAHLGWIDRDAGELYQEAIRASMQQWSAYDDEAFSQYMIQDDVAWDEENAEALIGIQKWIALFPHGFEAWAEWRRLDYPLLQPAPDALNASRSIPLRQGYPTSERDLNNENWQQAINTWLGGQDALNVPLWWDVD